MIDSRGELDAVTHSGRRHPVLPPAQSISLSQHLLRTVVGEHDPAGAIEQHDRHVIEVERRLKRQHMIMAGIGDLPQPEIADRKRPTAQIGLLCRLLSSRHQEIEECHDDRTSYPPSHPPDRDR